MLSTHASFRFACITFWSKLLVGWFVCHRQLTFWMGEGEFWPYRIDTLSQLPKSRLSLSLWDKLLHIRGWWQNITTFWNCDVCDVKVKDRVPSKELRGRLGIDDIILVLQQNRLQWYGHVLRKEDTDWVKKRMEYEVEGSRTRGRPKRTWREVVQKDCQAH